MTLEQTVTTTKPTAPIARRKCHAASAGVRPWLGPLSNWFGSVSLVQMVGSPELRAAYLWGPGRPGMCDSAHEEWLCFTGLRRNNSIRSIWCAGKCTQLLNSAIPNAGEKHRSTRVGRTRRAARLQTLTGKMSESLAATDATLQQIQIQPHEGRSHRTHDSRGGSHMRPVRAAVQDCKRVACSGSLLHHPENN
jgi:hypothetical protein